MRKYFEIGGYIASAVLVAFGAVAIWMGVSGFNEVRDSIARENIVAGGDAAEITGGALKPGEKITTGQEAKDFASIMRFHTLEATEGQTYAEMGRFLTESGEPTSDEAAAAKGPNGRPVENPLRQMWVTETALTTALNTSFMAERLAIFGIVVGVALVLAGGGFGIVTAFGALRAREEEQAIQTLRARTPVAA